MIIELLKALGLLALGMFVHILSGTGYAELKAKWNKEQMKAGIIKAGMIFIIIVGISLGASIDETLVIDNTPILEYILLAIKGIYAYYFAQAGIKVIKMISFKTEKIIDNHTEGEDI